MLPTKSKIHGICSVALVCSCLAVLIVLSVPPSPSFTETAASEEAAPIDPGTSRRGEISAGATKVFEVSASAGSVIRFSIDKGDLGLTTVVHNPRGAKALEHVSQDFEVVDVSVLADVSGTYRIELQSREKGDTQRAYELRLEAVTPITQSSQKDSEARKAIAIASVLRAQWAEASLRQVPEHYERAALIWTSLGNYGDAATATLKSGDIYFLFSEYAHALKRYQSAANLAARAGDRLAEAKALSRMGRLYSFTGKNDLAQTNLNMALDRLGPVDANTNPIVRNTYGETLSNIAEVTYAKGNMVKASDQLKSALRFLQGDRKGEAKVHMFAGYIAGNLGVLEKAIDELCHALRLYEATNDNSGEALALTTLGVSHTYQGDRERAIELQKKAIPIFQKIGNRSSEAIAFNALGEAYEKLKDYSTALVHYDKALQIFHTTGARDFETVTIFALAKLNGLMGRFDEALKLYERGLQLSRSAGKTRTEAYALSEIALVYARQRRTNETLRLYDRVLKFYEGINDSRGQAIALNARGDFLLEIGKKVEAAESFRRALSLSEKGADTETLINSFYNLARAERALGHLDDALSLVKRSLRMIEDSRTNVGSPELRASYFSGAQKNYELCINILTDLDRARPGDGFGVEALLKSEQSRARLLVDLIRESGAGLRKGVPQELVMRERELRGLIDKQAQYQLTLKQNTKDPSEIAEVENQIVQVKSEYQQLQAQIREQNPRALSLGQFEPISLPQIQNELLDDDLLLEFSLGEERSHLWVITTKSFQSFQLPARKEIEDVAIELYKSLTVRQQLTEQSNTATYQTTIEESDQLFKEKANTLSQMLLGQVAPQLGTKRLVLVTDGVLRRVPFAALPVPGAQTSDPKWLLEDHEIVHSPSIATLRAIRSAGNEGHSTGKVAAVIADPVFTISDNRVQRSSLSPAVESAASDENRNESAQKAFGSLRSSSGLSRLTHSSEEADAIAAAAPRGTTMIARGFDATRDTAMSVPLGEYQILHFATHGFLNNDHPELSGIVLTMVDKNGVEKNGVMPLHDIYSLDLSVELTVLSACQTALGKDIKGEGYVGLTHSFISAGSKSVVSSLWKVDDRATARLMADFYQSMLQKGMTPAAALRAAKLKLMQDKRWSAPYFWAGFVVQGEYTNHIAVENNSWRHVGVLVLLSLLLVSSGVIFVKGRRIRRTSDAANQREHNSGVIPPDTF